MTIQDEVEGRRTVLRLLRRELDLHWGVWDGCLPPTNFYVHMHSGSVTLSALESDGTAIMWDCVAGEVSTVRLFRKREVVV